MFRWYRNAAKCYVYLADVLTNDRDQINTSLVSWEPAFRKSRWFTCGWTLQELLAPSYVEFFCSSGKRLGDNISLERQLHEITRIALEALQGTYLSKFNVDERLLWAKTRETKRDEDKAYSLLGIFNIHMPLIYGEGAEHAFRWLRKEISKSSYLNQDEESLINRLPYAVSAPHNAYYRQHEPICLPDTRIDLLEAIYNWAGRLDAPCIFWLNGLAGTGKLTIAQTVTTHLSEKGILGASFFFSRGGGDIGYAGKFITTIAVQLTNNIPTLKHVKV